MEKIYKLIDPRTGAPKYIGKTRLKLNQRLRDHIRGSKKKNITKKERWICKLLKLGLQPQIKLIKRVKSKSWQYWEILYIAKYQKAGHKLVNGTKGGDGPLNYIPTFQGRKHTEESRKKMSEANKGKVISEEQKLKVSKFHKGRKRSLSTKLKMQKAKEAYLRPIQGINIKTGVVRDFKSASHAVEELLLEGIIIKRRNLGACLNQRTTHRGLHIRKSAYGFKWVFK